MASLGSVAPAAGAGGAAKGGKAAAAVEEKPKEEEAADVDMGGLFGDEEYWVFLTENHLIVSNNLYIISTCCFLYIINIVIFINFYSLIL